MELEQIDTAHLSKWRVLLDPGISLAIRSRVNEPGQNCRLGNSKEYATLMRTLEDLGEPQTL